MQNINYKEFEDIYMPSNFDEVVDSCNLKPSRKVILKEIVKYSQYNSLHGCFFSERELAKITKYTINGIIKALRDLRRAGLISCNRLLDLNGRKGITCIINEREEKRIFMITYVNWDKFEGEPKFKL